MLRTNCSRHAPEISAHRRRRGFLKLVRNHKLRGKGPDESAWRIDYSAAPRRWTITEQRYGCATENSHACRECFRFVSSGSVGRQTDPLDQALIGLSILGELLGELLGRLSHGLDALFEQRRLDVGLRRRFVERLVDARNKFRRRVAGGHDAE